MPMGRSLLEATSVRICGNDSCFIEKCLLHDEHSLKNYSLQLQGMELFNAGSGADWGTSEGRTVCFGF